MDMVSQRDLLSTTLGMLASPFAGITAGTPANAAPVVGLVIDRNLVALCGTVVFMAAYQATMAAGDTLSVGSLLVEHSTDSVVFSPYATPAAFGVVAAGPAGGGIVRGTARVGVELRMAQRFIRFTFTPTLSAGGGDTVQVVALAEFAGFDRLPPVLGSVE